MSNQTSKTLLNLLVLTIFLVAASVLSLAVLSQRRTKEAAAPAAVVTSPSPSPSVTPPPKPKTAVTNATVYVRSGKGTNSSILGVIESGVTVTLGNDSDTNWQEIVYKNSRGYIFKAYLKY